MITTRNGLQPSQNDRRGRRHTCLAVSFSLVTSILLGLGPDARADAPPADHELRPGHAVFWNGPTIVESGPHDDVSVVALAEMPASDACGTRLPDPEDPGNMQPEVECYAYELIVDDVAPGAELRVAVDHRSASDFSPAPPHLEHFAIEVSGPTGQVAHDSGQAVPLPAQQMFTAEARVVDPTPGVWTVTIEAIRVRQGDFRARAYLAPPPENAGPRRLLYPNLQSTPPFELSFSPCLDVEPANHCLRFAQGPTNVGDGPLDIDVNLPPTLDAGSGVINAPETQKVHYSDGSEPERFDIGHAEYHQAPGHMHYHHIATGGYELLAASPATGTTRLIGPGTKQGFCLGDYAIANWRSLNQDAHRTATEYVVGLNCGTNRTPTTSNFGLTRGWADTYSAGVEGNYVDFTNPVDNDRPLPDGFYVVRATTNPCEANPEDTGDGCHGKLIEGKYDDNASYAYFEVATTADGAPTIRPIERGRGRGPFDRDKEVVNDGRRFLPPPDPTFRSTFSLLTG
jgi:hypothetical protein